MKTSIYEDLEAILDSFEAAHYSLFYKFATLSVPVIDRKIPTAAVRFNKLGDCIEFAINPDYWDTRTFEQKRFIIAHECIHVMFNHGRRIFNLGTDKKKVHPQIANIAADIVVNHTLEDTFYFKRKEVDPESVYCWIDTVFKGTTPLPSKDANFEYYYTLLMDKFKDKIKQMMENLELVDCHEGLDGMDSSEVAERLSDFLDPDDIKKIKKKLEENGVEMDPKKPNQMRDTGKPDGKEEEGPDGNKPGGKLAGTERGDIVKEMLKRFIPKKKKWETVIKNWVRKNSDFTTIEQWARKDRRWSNLDTGYMLPSDLFVEEDERRKIDVWFFQDTSGSCVHLADRFFNAARSIPTDRFNIKMFCFDTAVYETTLASGKLYGFGGTSFTCIEDYIQSKINDVKAKQHYPHAVFIITDGYGDNVSPQKPKNWHWFLSENYKSCIPKESPTFMLKDFE